MPILFSSNTLTALLVFLSCQMKQLKSLPFGEKHGQNSFQSCRLELSSIRGWLPIRWRNGLWCTARTREKTFSNGDIYDGQFEKGFRHGHGTHHRYKADSMLERFIGMWANDEWDGYGKLVLRWFQNCW